MRKFPVWRIAAKWDNADYQDNGTGYYVSHRRRFSDGVIRRKAERYFARYFSKKYPTESVTLKSLEIDYLGDFTWFPIWFSHKSFNRFDTEREAFDSFMEYLYNEVGPLKDDDFIKRDRFGRCLMGAEDYWRWKYCDKNCCKRLKQTIISH